MTKLHETISAYWNQQFPVAPAKAGSVGIAMTSNFHGNLRAMLLERPGSDIRATMTPEVFDRLGYLPQGGLSPSQLRTRLEDLGIKLNGPDFIYSFPESAAAHLQYPVSASPIRELTKADTVIFEAFQAASCEEDLNGSSVDIDDWIVLGAFDGRRLVAAASMYQWNGAPIADVGVLTLPDARRKGHAANLVRACATRALDEGYRLQYRSQIDNAGSIALAASLGLVLEGIWTAEQR